MRLRRPADAEATLAAHRSSARPATREPVEPRARARYSSASSREAIERARKAGASRSQARPRVLPAHGPVRRRALPRRRRHPLRRARGRAEPGRRRRATRSSARCTGGARTPSAPSPSSARRSPRTIACSPCTFELAELLLEPGRGRRGRSAAAARGARGAGRGAGRAGGAPQHAGEPRPRHARVARERALAGRARQPRATRSTGGCWSRSTARWLSRWCTRAKSHDPARGGEGARRACAHRRARGQAAARRARRRA